MTCDKGPDLFGSELNVTSDRTDGRNTTVEQEVQIQRQRASKNCKKNGRLGESVSQDELTVQSPLNHIVPSDMERIFGMRGISISCRLNIGRIKRLESHKETKKNNIT